MKVSLNAIGYLNKHYKTVPDQVAHGPKELITKIGAQLGAIDEVVEFGKKYSGVRVVRLVNFVPHPSADRLKVCLIDDGGKTRGIKRTSEGLIQIVCGANNLKVGMLAVWLKPGLAVPSTVDKEPMVLEARELRGQISYGMLASAKELDLSDDHSGILEVDWPAKPGDLFGDVYHLTNDVVLDIENKMFTHRPDCFGYLGIAREIEGINHKRYKSPKWYTAAPKFPGITGRMLKLVVKNELPQLVPRFSAITLSDVKVGPSPVWLQVDLARVGLRSINNIVDYTNWYMLLTGQPLHAYDYDKVLVKDPGAKQATLTVRYPKKDETLTLLNGKVVKPREKAIMIATATQAIGIGGVMGGADTEVDERTTNIILESATFDMYSIRHTSMEHGLFTDAVTRFTKGQSPLQNLAVLSKVVNEITTNAHGKVAGSVIDINNLPKSVRTRRSLHPPVRLTAEFVNSRLGLSLSRQDISKLLTNVEFDVTLTGSDISVTAPFWRTDIEIPEDVVEEVGRLNGYDKLPLALPKRDLTPAAKNRNLELKESLRQVLSAAGANELLTYSFVHGNLLDAAGQDKALAFRLSNALSPDLQYYRLSLVPSLLEKVHPNIKAGYGEFGLFEIGKVHCKGVYDQEGLPKELPVLGLVFAADTKTASGYQGAAFYQAKTYLSQVMELFGGLRAISFKALSEAGKPGAWVSQITAPYDPNRSAVLLSQSGKTVGILGEFKASTRAQLKLPDFSAGFELFIDELMTIGPKNSNYVRLPRFPKVEQDICLRVTSDVTYQAVYDLVQAELAKNKPENSHMTLEPVDIYQSEKDKTHKQITLRLSLASYERTLTDGEVSSLLDQASEIAKIKLTAKRV